MSDLLAQEIQKLKEKVRELESRLGVGQSSKVFKMFDKGTSPIEVVKRTNIEPEIILRWFEIWLRWKEMKYAKDKNTVEQAG